MFKKFLNITTIFIIALVFTTNELVNALDNDKKKACRIIIVGHSYDTVYMNYIDQFGNESPKTGYLYKFKTVNSNNTLSEGFCLDPGKHVDNGYIRSDNPIPRSGYEGYYYKVYEWFRRNGDIEGAQIAIWYFSIAGASANEEAFTKTLVRYFVGEENTCECAEKRIRLETGLENFYCKCFFNHNANFYDTSGQYPKSVSCSKKNYMHYIPSALLEEDKYKSITDSEYNGWITRYSCTGTATNEKTKGIEAMAHSIWNGSMYDGNLYYYKPVGGVGNYQRFIGVGECTTEGYFCNQLYPDYLAGKYGSDLTAASTINAFKAAILDGNTVQIQPDGTAKCGNRRDEKTCLDLKDQANANCWTKEQLQARITDGDKVVGTTCNLDCEGDRKCDPVVDVSSADCDMFNKEPTAFTLQDAMKDGIPDPNCYKKGTAYKLIGEEKVGSLDEDLSVKSGDKYFCQVYCWEEVTADMPGAPSTPTDPAYAGRMMYWGKGDESNGWFATVRSHRICWTQPDYNAFSNAWSANENSIAENYDRYKKLKDFTDDDQYTSSACTATATCLEIDEGEEGTTCCWNFQGTRCLGYSDATSCAGHGNFETRGGRAASCSSCPDGYSNKSGTSCEADGTQYSRTVGEISVTTTCYKDSPSDIDAAIDSYVSKERDEKLAAVKSGLKHRFDLSNAIQACQSKSRINENSMYKNIATMKFKTDASINLSNYGVNGEYTLEPANNIPPEVTTTSAADTPASQNYTCSSAPLVESDYYTNDTSISNPCTVSGGTYFTNINKYTEYQWDFQGQYDYYYPKTKFMFYVFKDTMKIINEDGKPRDYIFNKNLYYKEGYGFPLSFQLLEGTYNISVEIKKLGNNGHFDKVLEQTNSKETYSYDFQEGLKCPFYVWNPIYKYCPDCCPNPPCDNNNPPPSGGNDDLDVIYRVIEMGNGNKKKIFPSIDGDGRKICTSRNDTNCIGSNWASFIGKNNGTNFKNITNSKVIYTTKPLYSIELTPTNISKIRKDNKELRENNMDPYTSYTDKNNNIKITCTGDGYDNRQNNIANDIPENKSCVSSYVTTLMSDKYNVIVGGVFKNPNETKRLDKISAYKKCYDSANPNCK